MNMSRMIFRCYKLNVSIVAFAVKFNRTENTLRGERVNTVLKLQREDAIILPQIVIYKFYIMLSIRLETKEPFQRVNNIINNIHYLCFTSIIL